MSGDGRREDLKRVSEVNNAEEPRPPPPKRKRRTGWSDPPVVENSLYTAEQIQADIAERQARATAMPSALQDRATRHQLCRVYVGSLDYTLSDHDIRQVFSVFGPIVNIDMPRESGRSKGFCFVEYANPESADAALATMTNFVLRGRTIKVGRPTSLTTPPAVISPSKPNSGNIITNNNVITPTTIQTTTAVAPITVTTTATPTPTGSSSSLNAAEAGQIAAAMLLTKSNEDENNTITTSTTGIYRVYVGNVPYEFSAEDVRKIFEVFGPVISCQLIPSQEKAGTHRGYGFVEFSKGEQAELAIEIMNGFAVAGKTLRVNYATTSVRPVPSIDSVDDSK